MMHENEPMQKNQCKINGHKKPIGHQLDIHSKINLKTSGGAGLSKLSAFFVCSIFVPRTNLIKKNIMSCIFC
jgi:hypothetical protein